MEPVAQPSKPLKPSQIARDWTARGAAVSRQYVDKLMRKGVGGQKLEGEHVASLAAAWQWRTARTRFFVSGKGEGAEQNPAAVTEKPTGTAVPVSSDTSIEAMLDRVKEAEAMAFQLWQRELLAKEPDLMRVNAARREYNETAGIRVDVEKRVAQYRKEIGQAVDLEEAQQMIDDRLAPFRSALNGLDRELAQALFPEDAARHRQRIRSTLARVLLGPIANAKKRLRAVAIHHGQPRVAA